MGNDTSSVLSLVVFACLFVLAIIEAILQWRWNRWYFGTGVRVFLREVRGVASQSLILDTASLEAEFFSRLTKPILFRNLAAGEFAFRESSKRFRLFSYTPIMHGLVRREPYSGTVLIEGKLNWHAHWFPVFIVLFAFSLTTGSDIPVADVAWLVLFPLVVYGALYLVQRRRYRKVADAVQKQLSGAPVDQQLVRSV